MGSRTGIPYVSQLQIAKYLYSTDIEAGKILQYDMGSAQAGSVTTGTYLLTLHSRESAVEFGWTELIDIKLSAASISDLCVVYAKSLKTDEHHELIIGRDVLLPMLSTADHYDNNLINIPAASIVVGSILFGEPFLIDNKFQENKLIVETVRDLSAAEYAELLVNQLGENTEAVVCELTCSDNYLYASGFLVNCANIGAVL